MREEPEPAPEIPLPISVPIPVARIPSASCTGEIAADRSQCAALADLLEVRAIEHFWFSYDLSGIGRGRFRLTGALKVKLQQDCVVTLDPLETRIDDTFTLELWPEKDVALSEKLALEEGRSIMFDGPEPIEDGVIDVGQLAYEHLSSMIDPYPKRKDIEFQWVADTDVDDKPFAALGAMLRKKTK